MEQVAEAGFYLGDPRFRHYRDDFVKYLTDNYLDIADDLEDEDKFGMWRTHRESMGQKFDPKIEDAIRYELRKSGFKITSPNEARIDKKGKDGTQGSSVAAPAGASPDPHPHIQGQGTKSNLNKIFPKMQAQPTEGMTQSFKWSKYLHEHYGCNPVLAILTETGIVYTDRYDALGIDPPDPKTVCKGQCEGTGWVPIYMSAGDGRMSGGESVHTVDEDDPTFIKLWQEAEVIKPSLDGYHFVQCPACEGTGYRKGTNEHLIVKCSLLLHEHNFQVGDPVTIEPSSENSSMTGVVQDIENYGTPGEIYMVRGDDGTLYRVTPEQIHSTPGGPEKQFPTDTPPAEDNFYQG